VIGKLSTHTGGILGYTYRDLTEDMRPFMKHWKELDIRFDAVLIGKQERIGKGLFYFPRNSSMSSSTLPIPAIPKLSTNTLATLDSANVH